jgi:hypothetical protein
MEKTKLEPNLENYDVNVEKRPLRVLMHAWYASPAWDIYETLRNKYGAYVFWVGNGVPVDDIDGIDGLNTGKLPQHPVKQFRGPEGLVDFSEHRYSLQSILDMHRGVFDMIVHVQDWWYPEASIERSPIPYFYYFTEPFAPRIPKCAWHVFSTTPSMTELAMNQEGSRFTYSTLPWALRSEFQNQGIGRDRPIKCGFAGKIYSPGLYEDRKKIIFRVKELLGNDFVGHWIGKAMVNDVGLPIQDIDEKTGQPRRDKDGLILQKYEGTEGDGRLDIPEYLEFMEKCQFGINVPTRWGLNFRDLEVPAAGAELLTIKTRDAKDYGFIDGENCHFYKSPEEAAELVRNGYDRKIASAGWDLVRTRHNWNQWGNKFMAVVAPIIKPEVFDW